MPRRCNVLKDQEGSISRTSKGQLCWTELENEATAFDILIFFWLDNLERTGVTVKKVKEEAKVGGEKMP